MPTLSHNPESSAERSTVEPLLISIVRDLLNELGSQEAARKVTPKSSLDRDLGLGSLERVELLVRVEKRLGVRLPDDIAQRADSLTDWVQALSHSGSSKPSSSRWPIRQPAAPAPEAPAGAKSFSGILRQHADAIPDRVQIHLLEGDGGQNISYSHLLERSSEVAAGLLAAGLAPNDTVAIMLPTGEDFFYSFLGVMLAGGIAVPIYPPTRPDQIEEYVRRQTLILSNAEVRFLISFDRVRTVSKMMRLGLPSLVDVTTVAALRSRGRGERLSGVAGAETFFIQYTSGSTGDPKGVMLSHANVLANVQGIGGAVQANRDDIVVSWLPLYHDMGLIGSWLFSLFYGFPITIMSPLAFLSRPERWLWAMSDSGGTLSPAPNFSYELCARKISDESMEGVDLSAWRIAINAGEPVLPDTLERFAERFEPRGFRAESYVPCYGLAECSVALTFPPINRQPVIDTIRRDVFETQGRAEKATAEQGNVLRFVASGAALPDHEIRIVDDHDHAVAERTQGRVLFRGPSKTAGYYKNPEATAVVAVSGGWMDTGDLGYLAGGELHITGRKKDCIIKAGHNIMPREVEAAAEVYGVRRGCVAAFGVIDPKSGTESLVVVAETRSNNPAAKAAIRSRIISQVSDRVGLPPDHVALVPPQTIPKTSSGKIRRGEARSRFENSRLEQKKRAPWVQIARLWRDNLGTWARLSLGAAAIACQAAFHWFVVMKVGVTAGLMVRLAPTPALMVPIIRAAARLLRVLRSGNLEVTGIENINREEPALWFVNRPDDRGLLALIEAMPGTTLIAEERVLRSLPWPLSFMLEPLVTWYSCAGGNAAAGALQSRVRRAIQEGCSMLVVADSPLETDPVRSRFRLEPIQVAGELKCPLYPACVRAGEVPANGVSGGAAQHCTVIRAGRGLPVSGNGDPEHAALLRHRIREALRGLGDTKPPRTESVPAETLAPPPRPEKAHAKENSPLQEEEGPRR